MIPDLFLKVLSMSVLFSVILMTWIQKFKSLPFIYKTWHIWFLNFFFSFLLGIPFTMFFYKMDFFYGVWVSIFSFIGAPTIYDVLKNQTFLNYKPKSLSEGDFSSDKEEIVEEKGDIT